MSFHVYIARPGFKDAPIEREQWLSIAHSNERLKGTRNSDAASFLLSSDRTQRLTLDPNGLVHTQNPSRELVVVMFELAERLGAGVYSEKLKRYSSTEEWEERTRSYRAQHQRNMANVQSKRRKKLVMWLAVVVVAAVAGWFGNA
jgi:hypothetical protein